MASMSLTVSGASTGTVTVDDGSRVRDADGVTYRLPNARRTEPGSARTSPTMPVRSLSTG